MPSTRSRTVRETWAKADVERLIGWMEEHQGVLRGKQGAWHKDVKYSATTSPR